jgi:tetratricopeptide (TPR) repeat protein
MSPFLLREEIQTLREKRQGVLSPEYYRELSDLLLTAGKIPAAMNLLEHALLNRERFSPNPSVLGLEEVRACFRRGLEYADACLYEEAADCLIQALEAGYDTFETHYCLAGVYKSLGNLNLAGQHCRKSLEHYPAFSPAFILLGSIVKLEGRLPESIDAVRQALSIDPDCAAAYYDLACYLALAGDREPALDALEQALAKGFEDLEWLLRDPDLDSLRKLLRYELLLRFHNPKNG